MAEIPSPAACATLDDDALHRLWAGLGYYRRARLLREAARAIVERHGGLVPADPAALAALPGFGPYTTGAVSALAFDLAEPAVDGNVVRVWARLHGVDTTAAAAMRPASAWARAVVGAARPSTTVEALMELGATVCMQRRAHCGGCPLRDACVAATWPDPTRTPRAPAKKPRPEEVLLHVWLTDGERLWLRRRPTGLLGDRPAPWALDWPAAGAPTRLDTELGPAVLEALGDPFRHVFTHRTWRVTPGRYRLRATPSAIDPLWTSAPITAAAELGLPTAFAKGLNVLSAEPLTHRR